MKKYQPNLIENKWQKRWKEDNLFASKLSEPNKYYVLAEFAYPSGDLHMGHWFTFTGADVYARFKRMQGYNVFFPNGFDAFGLPAENAAIKRGIHPQDWTLSNIERMKEQFATMGASFTFDHEVITCLPEYYHWNQWIFLKMLEKGLAYRGTYLSNWCNTCQTVLANEAVESGNCWRCGNPVVQKAVKQWFYKITDYADKLIWSDPPVGGPLVDWPKSLREAQNNWIGKSKGVVIKFTVSKNESKTLEAFTTRPDTLFGATFVVISPEHPLLDELTGAKEKEEVDKYVDAALKKSELERKENREKIGVFTGSFVKNPLTCEDIPVWVADYVLGSYGTGAIMAVPAHDSRDFEFAKKYNLPIKKVVAGGELPYEGDGILANSGEYSGLTSQEAKEKISNYIVEHNLGRIEVQYHLHDWSISRQRYWGTPIPMTNCKKCGLVPVSERDLPVELPYEVDYAPKGKPPLASNEAWLKTTCPKCGGAAEREPETMDTFIDSSWYFFRYVSPHFDKRPFDSELAKKIMPADIYFGGPEHNLGHTLYSRFFTKFFKDLGLTSLEEYASKRINHGIVLGPDGFRMSKSRGNVVNPDEEVKKYGADAVRVHLSFFMPYYDSVGPWVSERIWGPYHFLERVWNLFDKVAGIKPSKEDLFFLNRTVNKISNDIEKIGFNTAVAALMEWLNYLSRKKIVSKEEYKTLLLLLAPFAPHVTEELWEMVGGKYSVHQQSWPEVDNRYLEEEEMTVVIQINGKMRDQIVIQKDAVNNKEVVEKIAVKSAKVQKFLGNLSADRRIKKTIYVPGKVFNIVI